MKHDAPVIRKIRVTRSIDVNNPQDNAHIMDGVMIYDERCLSVSDSILRDAEKLGRVECEIECVNVSHGSMKRVGQIVRRGDGSKSTDINYERWVGPDVAIVHDAGQFSVIVAPIPNPFANSSS